MGYMFLNTIIRCNPRLIRAAVDLHQSGQVNPNTYLLDLDAVKHNAEIIKKEAKRVGLSLYPMTKQIGRNPIAAKIMTSNTSGAVAVDIEGVMSLYRYRIPIGHVGHLIQIPKNKIEYVLREVEPEVITVYSIEKAKEISEVAEKLGKVQELLVRVVAEGDFFYPGQEGGFYEEELIRAVRVIDRLKGVKVTGVTSFPCMVYNKESEKVEPTPNFETIIRAAYKLEKELGIEIKQINAPGTTSTVILEHLAEKGATHAEPGHGFTGTTPLHAFRDLPEIPALIYVSEVSHLFEGRAYSFGGGIFIDILACNDYQVQALVGRSPDEILEKKVRAESDPFGYIGKLYPDPGVEISVGDTVIYGFRAQLFCCRSNVAVVGGIQQNRPKLLGTFDRTGNMLDSEGNPFSLEEAFRQLQSVLP